MYEEDVTYVYANIFRNFLHFFGVLVFTDTAGVGANLGLSEKPLSIPHGILGGAPWHILNILS